MKSSSEAERLASNEECGEQGGAVGQDRPSARREEWSGPPPSQEPCTHFSMPTCTPKRPAISGRRWSISATRSRKARCWPKSMIPSDSKPWSWPRPRSSGPRPPSQQARARKTAAEAAVSAAEAAVDVRRPRSARPRPIRRFREKEYLRYIELARLQTVDQRVADEQQENFEGAKADEERASAAVKAAEAEVARAVAQVVTAEADIQHARAEQRVAEADWRRPTILAQYLRLVSPYTGVVTQRNFHDGDFVRDAIRNDDLPILTIARTDLMRVIIYVPDRDTPLLDRGDEAVVRIDALGGEEFTRQGCAVLRGGVADQSNHAYRSRSAQSHGAAPAGHVRGGLDPARAADDFLTIPSKALHELQAGAGAVYVVADDQARKRPIRIGRDDGIRVEVQSGLSTDDEVIVSYAGSMQDGEPVRAEPIGEAEGQGRGSVATGGGRGQEEEKAKEKSKSKGQGKGS